MKKAISTAAKARKNLDIRLGEGQALRQKLARPNQGWIRAIRQALGMTAEQLGHRMGITQATLSGLEASEINGAIRLATLRKAAEAMNCTLVYALVPNTSLEDIVQGQARKVAAEQLKPVEHTMLLENQSLHGGVREEFLQSYVENEIDFSKLWR
ncbi:mobile mystery protein A [Dyella acidisoli]|uniref:Transcriptional regulator n=1 Tax=Dyella acidisoli TaxID=1867834 RepID=A0ABQ5XQ84_9GAMM|nr:mobile mystery protein A [Dyella acidisoli]GLQ93768.1 transcriptional regulator [Dyella acidisoli]